DGSSRGLAILIPRTVRSGTIRCSGKWGAESFNSGRPECLACAKKKPRLASGARSVRCGVAPARALYARKDEISISNSRQGARGLMSGVWPSYESADRWRTKRDHATAGLARRDFE